MLADIGFDVKEDGVVAMAEPFTLTSQRLGPLPVLNHFLARIGLARLLECYLPHDDARLRLAPATVIGVAVANIVVGHRPVYALGGVGERL